MGSGRGLAAEEEEAGPVGIVADLESRIVESGTATEIRVVVSGRPAETLWMKNGKEIKPSAAADMEEGPAPGEFRLRLTAPVPEDSGAYVFEARPAPGHGPPALSTATVLIVAPDKPPSPVVIRLPQPTTVPQNATAKFTLEVKDITGLTGETPSPRLKAFSGKDMRRWNLKERNLKHRHRQRTTLLSLSLFFLVSCLFVTFVLVSHLWLPTQKLNPNSKKEK